MWNATNIDATMSHVSDVELQEFDLLISPISFSFSNFPLHSSTTFYCKITAGAPRSRRLR